jgi:hypothetical protein
MEHRREASRPGWLLPILASICAATISCGQGSHTGQTINSQRLENEEIDADIDVFGLAPGRIVVEAELEHEDSLERIYDVELSTDDEIDVTLPNGQKGALKRAKGRRYRARFDTSPSEGQVRIHFRDEHVDVDLRPAFSVTSPTPGQVFGFQDDLNIAWTPAEPGQQIQIWIHRSCRTTAGATRDRSTYVALADDNGSYVYDLSALPEATDPTIDTSADCPLEVELRRIDSSGLFPMFGFGSVQSIQARAVENLLLTF